MSFEKRDRANAMPNSCVTVPIFLVNSRIYFLDCPGGYRYNATHTDGYEYHRINAKTFVRVKFNNTDFTDIIDEGSLCSMKEHWYSRLYCINKERIIQVPDDMDPGQLKPLTLYETFFKNGDNDPNKGSYTNIPEGGFNRVIHLPNQGVFPEFEAE